ncbi:MAG: tetratricopeptide repeat protein [Nostoc sp.]
MGDIKGAINDYTSAISINKQNGITYFNRSFCYYKINNIKEAIDDYNQALKLSYKLINSKQARKLKELLYPPNKLELTKTNNLELINHYHDENEDEPNEIYVHNDYSEYEDRQLDYGYLEDLDNDDYYYYFKGCREL